MSIYTISLFGILPFLDRLAGSDAKLPFSKKLLRRILIPTCIYIVDTSFERLLFCVLLGIIFSFNLNEIEPEHHNPQKRDWEEIALYGLALTFCLYTLCFNWAWLVCLLWVCGVYLSNNGVFGYKLNWKYVEIGRGLAMALAINL